MKLASGDGIDLQSIYLHTYISIELYHHACRGGSGGPAGTVLAGPLFKFSTVLLAVNHYKTTN